MLQNFNINDYFSSVRTGNQVGAQWRLDLAAMNSKNISSYYTQEIFQSFVAQS